MSGTGREVERLRRTALTQTARGELARGMRIIARLHGAPIAMLVATRLGIERDTLLLGWAGTRALDHQRTWRSLLSLWSLIDYPVTASEYAAIAAIEREELESLDAYADVLAECEGSEEGLHPQIAALLRECSRAFDWDGRGADGDEAQDAADGHRDDKIPQRIRQVMDAAINGEELPQPQRTEQGLMLPRGVLRDWGEGTTAETDEPLGPVFCVPALELLGGDAAQWNIRPDDEVQAVMSRRADLWHVFTGIVRGATHMDEAILEAMTLEPPSTLAEREHAAEVVQQYWPWRLDGFQADVRAIVSQQMQGRSEVQAVTNVVAHLQQEVFGGEDPLDPEVRALLTEAEQVVQAFVEMLVATTDWLPSTSLDENPDWPPSLESTDTVTRCQRELELHLVGSESV